MWCEGQLKDCCRQKNEIVLTSLKCGNNNKKGELSVCKMLVTRVVFIRCFSVQTVKHRFNFLSVCHTNVHNKVKPDSVCFSINTWQTIPAVCQNEVKAFITMRTERRSHILPVEGHNMAAGLFAQSLLSVSLKHKELPKQTGRDSVFYSPLILYLIKLLC